MEDNAIVDLYWSRSEEAIVQTEKAYGSYCRQVAWNILRSAQDAEECVNDTWLRAWNAMPTHRPASLRAFLGKVTRNLSLDRWEKAHAEKRGGGRTGLLLSELSECVPDPDTVERMLEDRAVSAAIARWLRQQSPKHRVAFVRRYFYADSLTQVAKRIGMTEGGTKSLLHRQRLSLRKFLEQEGIAL